MGGSVKPCIHKQLAENACILRGGGRKIQGGGGGRPDGLLCSRNARSQTPLVGRAQWGTNQATLWDK